MITIICGKIRIGKTALMTFLGLLNALNFDKRERLRKSLYDLKKRGYKVKEGDFALYSDYSITYDDQHGSIYQSTKIDPLMIGESLFIKPHSTLLISEGQGYFNNRRSMTFTAKQSLFFQTSGHYGIDIFIDCQDVETIEKNIRNISTIIEVKERICIDIYNKKVNKAEKRTLKKIIFDVIRYNDISDYEKRIGKKDTIICDYNIFDCYNSFERFNDYLPQDKRNIII